MSARTRGAKALFWLAGQLSRIKTYHRTYEMVDLPDGGYDFKPLPRRWLSCDMSNRVMSWSMELDRRHWDHWALIHDRCAGAPCAGCGGTVCDAEVEALR